MTRTARLLRVSEERWRTLFETSSVGVVTIDTNRRVITANSAFQSMVGYTEAELQALEWRDLTHEDDQAFTDALNAELENGRRQSYQKEKRYLRKDGELVWASVNASYVPATETSPAFFLSMIVDTTERKRAELERRRLASIVEQASDLMAIADLQGTPIYLNNAGLKMVGFDDWEQAKARRGLHYMFPEDRPFVNEVLWPAVMENGSWSGELRFRHFKTGQAIPMLYSAFRIDDPETGQPTNVGNVCRDITDRKRAEEALRRSQVELARVVRVTTIGELGASIAHEINQPLAAILASGNACKRWLHNERDLGRARESLDRILSDADRAAEIVKRIRGLTRNTTPEYVRLDMNELIKEVITFTQSELQAKQVSLRTDLQTDAPAVVGDRVQLQQVLLNLIMNGVEAMASSVDRARELVITSRLDGDGAVAVMVQDVGTGLDPNEAPRIFDAFFTTKPNGMGMGLSISRSIIEAHGGQLHAAPAKPHGTVLIFTVPVADGSRS
jgi:PAS domain S-box-containing protein